MFGTYRSAALLKVLAALSLMLLPLLGTVTRVGAQDTGLIDDGTYVVELNGQEVTWGNDWAFTEDSVIAETGFESFSLESDAGLLYLTFLVSSDQPSSVLEAYLSGFTETLGTLDNVDSGEAGTGDYSLDIVTTDDGSEIGLFSTIVDDGEYYRLAIAVGPSQGVGDTFDAAASSIEIDGDPLFSGIESVSATSVEAGSGSGNTEDPTEEATEEDEETPEDDGGSGSGGQTGDSSYTFELNGAEVAWDDPWVLDDSLINVESDFESIGFVGGTYIQSILYLPAGTNLEDARDSFLEGFASDDVQVQEIDRGAYENVSYSLDLTMVDTVLFGLFTVYIDDGSYVRSFATLAPEANLGDAVDLAASTITIDGEPIYDGVTGSGLQDLIDASASDFTPTDTVDAGADDEETPEATEEDEETPEATEEDEETPEATEEDEETPEATDEDEKTPKADDEDISDDLVDAGVISATEYESPQYGFGVEWDKNWRIYEDLDDGGATSDPASGVDALSIFWVPSDDGDGFASINLTVQPAEGATTDDYVGLWTSDEFLADVHSEDVEIVDSDSTDTEAAVIIRDTFEGSDLIIYRGAVLLDDGETVVTYTLLAESAVAVDAWDDGSTGIEVDGEPILTLLEIEDSITSDFQ